MNKQLLLVILLSFTSLYGSAQTDTTRRDTTVISLQTLEIRARSHQQIPTTFQSLNRSALQAQNIGQEPSFILSTTPSITNYSDAGHAQGYSYIRMRGIDQTRINLTYNGVPMNEPEDQGAFFSNFADIMNSVSRVEIQRGVSTTKNGTSSYAGSIELVGPNLYQDSSRTTFGLGYGSFNSFRIFGEHNTGIKNNKSLYVRASQVYSDGYKHHASNNSQSAQVSGGLFYDKHTWKLDFLIGNQRNGMSWLAVADTMIQKDRRSNGNSKQETDRFMQMITQLSHNYKINSNSWINTSIYHTLVKGDYDFDFNNFLGLLSTDELYKYAIQSNLVGVYSNYHLVKNKVQFSTGVHGNMYKRNHIGSERSMGQLYHNYGIKNEISAFAKVVYSLKNFSLFADAQARHVDFQYHGDVAFNKLNWTFINPKAGVTYNLKNHQQFYYSAGFSGREPTRTDIFYGNDNLLADSLGNAAIGNTKAEYVIDQELGWRYMNSKFSFQVNAYFMNFKNEIVLDGKFGPNGLALTNNVARSYRTGLELSVQYKPAKFIVFINNSSFNYSRIIENNVQFSPILTPPLIVNQEVVFFYKKFTFAINARYQHQSYIDFANEATVKSYVLLNARASYAWNGFTFSAFLNNITNARYYNHGYVEVDGTRKYFVQAPINAYFAIQYSF